MAPKLVIWYLKAMKSLMFLSLFVAHFALAKEECKLPVCDIPAQIESMRKGTQNDRYQVIGQLLKTYRNSEDAVALQNLRAFGTAAIALFKEVKEEDWVIRSANDLHAESVVGIARYERPVSSQNLVEYYLELGAQETRFLILSYWANQISTIDETDVLSELMTFVLEAKRISTEAKEDEYMLRQADQILEKASARYTQINPFHEGLYSVEIECKPDTRVKIPCSTLVMMIDRLMIMDTQSTNGLMVTFSESSSETRVFEYALSSFSDVNFQGVTRVTQRPSQFVAKIDRTTGIITGTLTTTQTLGINYKFVARPIRTAMAFSTKDGLGKNENIAGLYEGTLGDQYGQFIIRKFEDGSFRASWISSDTPGFQIDFQTHVTVGKKGLLAFVAHPAGKGEFKLFLQKHIGPCSTLWSGFYLIPQGRANEVKLLKIANDDQIVRDQP